MGGSFLPHSRKVAGHADNACGSQRSSYALQSVHVSALPFRRKIVLIYLQVCRNGARSCSCEHFCPTGLVCSPSANLTISCLLRAHCIAKKTAYSGLQEHSIIEYTATGLLGTYTLHATYYFSFPKGERYAKQVTCMLVAT
jgi:hypothetical protein